MRELNRLQGELDRLFEGPFGDWPTRSESFGGWAPAIDVFEDKDRFTVKAELPGMKKEDINLTVEGNTLCISGERHAEENLQNAESHRVERYWGRFQRNIALPQAVQQDKIDATYRDGVLTVNLPKAEDAKRKQIEVKTS